MKASYRDDHAFLFELRLTLGGRKCTVRAWEAPRFNAFTSFTHTRVDVEVREAGRVIFPRGQLYMGIPGHASIDGDYAKEAALSLVGMKPGDTDRDYFDGYTFEQRQWAAANGDEISMVRMHRYCDEDGNLRREAR